MKKSVLLMFAVLAMVLSGCSSDNEEDNSIVLDSKEVSIYSGNKFQIEAKSEKSISYQSDDEYHARVSVSGLITANKVGKTNIVLTNGYESKTVEVTVKGKSNLYPEPYLKWGTTRDDLIKLLGQPDSETEKTIAYTNYSTSVPAILYAFDGNNTLNAVILAVKSLFSSELATYLGERYIPYTSEKNSIYYINGYTDDTVTMGIQTSLNNINYWTVLYFPVDLNSKTTQSKTIELDRIVEVLIKDKE